jgi:hypothetical protein
LQLNNDSWRNLLLSMAPPPETEQDSESDTDNRTGDLPADDWHDSHDNFGLDDDY